MCNVTLFSAEEILKNAMDAYSKRKYKEYEKLITIYYSMLKQ